MLLSEDLDGARPPVVFRPALAADLGAVLDLLARAALPTEGVREVLGGFVIAEVAGRVIGAAAVEPAGSAALLRSVVVSPEHRGAGVASRLVALLLEDAAARVPDGLWLLTESAAPFFARHGFVVADRRAAPPAVLATAEFARLCPASATPMVWRG